MRLTIDGYFHFHDPKIIDLGFSCLESMKWKCVTERNMSCWINEYDNHPNLLPFANYINETYTKNINDTLKLLTYNTFNGVDPDTEVWHIDHYEGNHISFLCYFDDLSEKTGGSISFRYPEVTIYPKIGDIIIMSHYTSHEHIVELMKGDYDRKVIHIGFA